MNNLTLKANKLRRQEQLIAFIKRITHNQTLYRDRENHNNSLKNQE